MGIPEYLLLAWLAGGLLQGIVNHDKPRIGKYDAYASLMGIGLMIALLIWGGFFK